MMIDPRLTAQLKRHEGYRRFPYRDTVGKLTIGIGRNLDDVGISDLEAEFLLERDLDKCVRQCARFPWWDRLDSTRQAVLLNMCFNMGFAGLGGFRNTLAAVGRGDYEAAAAGMLASKWARQVGRRAVELAEQMRTGVWS